MARRHQRLVGEPTTADEWDRVTRSDLLIAALRHQFRADIRRGGRRRVRLLSCAVAGTAGDVLPADVAALIGPLEAVADGDSSATIVTGLHAEATARSAAATRAQYARQTAHPGQPHRAELVAAHVRAQMVVCLTEPRPSLYRPSLLSNCVSSLRSLATGVYGTSAVRPIQDRTDRAFCQHLLCLYGNPFRPVALDSGWLTPTVAALARGIYDERAFDRLPVLADALEDAGCDQPDILGHLRGPGPHARGCWVVDLLLGKG